MIVSEMEERMTNDEFVRWSVFYARKAQRQDLEQRMGRR